MGCESGCGVMEQWEKQHNLRIEDKGVYIKVI